ncbi:hypothetical protein Tco_1045594 [Tanacetum coccineum]|uniref:Reverse transcriptase domain-containing protein n=1 Tax=Tanacetum coccineum TaxID=301880 RepID=A0ABQ5GU88_9ASTR
MAFTNRCVDVLKHHFQVCETFYACSDSLLLTPLCCDDIHEVTICVFALAGCDRMVSEPLVIENYVSLSRKKFCWETIFLIGLKCYRDPKEEPIGKETLMELKEIGLIDLRSGYHQLRECMKKIFQRLPLERGMDSLSYGYAFWINQCTSGFHRLNEPEHEVHLKLVLEMLKKEKLFVKFSKCELWLQDVHILGHVVNSNGIHMDPSKIEAVKNWKVPKTLSGIRSFLGLPGCVLMQRGKVENATGEMLRGLDQLMERKEGGGMYLLWVPLIGDVRTLMMDEAHASRYLVHSGADKTYYDLRDMYGGHVWRRILLPISWWKIYFADLVDIAEGIKNTAKTCVRLIILKWTDKDTHLPLTEFSIIIVIIRVFDVLYLKRCMEGSVGHMFFGLKLEKFGRLDQNWYKRQQIRVEVGDKVMLEVSSWKDVVHFGKKEMLAPRYKYLADTNLHVHLKDIKVDKTLRFVEEPIEIIDHEVKSLKRSRIMIVKSIGTRSEVRVIMEYLVNISKRRAFWSLNEDILKINDSDNQYACMTRSSNSELFTPYEEPEREFQSSRRHFKSLSLDELRSPNFNLFFDQEYSEEEEEEAMAETMDQYMSKTRTGYGSGVARPKIEERIVLN